MSITFLEDDVLPDDHYLCTGLDMYLSIEPDVMTSMALVHSRIRRVYYLQPDLNAGALGTHAKIHTLKSLNHKYRVFRVLRSVVS